MIKHMKVFVPQTRVHVEQIVMQWVVLCRESAKRKPEKDWKRKLVDSDHPLVHGVAAQVFIWKYSPTVEYSIRYITMLALIDYV